MQTTNLMPNVQYTHIRDVENMGMCLTWANRTMANTAAADNMIVIWGAQGHTADPEMGREREGHTIQGE